MIAIRCIVSLAILSAALNLAPADDDILPAVIMLTTSRDHTATGSPILITESLETTDNVEVVGVFHTVYRLAYFSQKTNGLLSISPLQLLDVESESIFAGFPSNSVSAHALRFDVDNKNLKAFKWTAKPLRAGAFAVTTRWIFKSGKSVVSLPKVFVFLPPKDHDGNYVIIPDILKED